MSSPCHPYDVEHVVCRHPLDEEFGFELLVHEDRVVLDDLIEVTDTLDSAFEEFRFETLLAHFQFEDFELLR